MDSSGNLVIIRDIQAASQETRHHAATLRGEMIHAIQRGVPYFETAFGASPIISLFEAAIRRRVMECPGVQEIEFLAARQNGDVLNYEATIKTVFGRVTING